MPVVAGLLRCFVFKYMILLINYFSLEEVLMQEGKLYLVFEFLSMDLKKYIDSIPKEKMLEKQLVKVSSFSHQLSLQFCLWQFVRWVFKGVVE